MGLAYHNFTKKTFSESKLFEQSAWSSGGSPGRALVTALHQHHLQKTKSWPSFCMDALWCCLGRQLAEIAQTLSPLSTCPSGAMQEKRPRGLNELVIPQIERSERPRAAPAAWNSEWEGTDGTDFTSTKAQHAPCHPTKCGIKVHLRDAKEHETSVQLAETMGITDALL